MFKNLNIFRIVSGGPMTIGTADEALDALSFMPCGSTQTKSVGWVPPRGEANSALIESVSGQYILKLMIETRSVPSATVRKKADEAAERVEQDTGRKPGKKHMKELREDALLSLLPQAFPRQAAVWVWIDRDAGLLVIDASSQPKIDEVITALVRTFDGLQLQLLQTSITPQTAMTGWLTQDPQYWPDGFHVERACELKGCDEEKSAVRFSRHNLSTDEIRKHIAEGKLPTTLALSYDGRVSFVLTETMRLKKVALLDGALVDRDDEADGFDTDVAITTGGLQPLIKGLVAALGGELKTADLLFGE